MAAALHRERRTGSGSKRIHYFSETAEGGGSGDGSDRDNSADPDASVDAHTEEQENSQGMNNLGSIEEDSDDEDLSFLREALGDDAP